MARPARDCPGLLRGYDFASSSQAHPCPTPNRVHLHCGRSGSYNAALHPASRRRSCASVISFFHGFSCAGSPTRRGCAARRRTSTRALACGFRRPRRKHGVSHPHGRPSTKRRTPTYGVVVREGACAPPVTKVGWTPDHDGTVWLDSGGKKAATTPGSSGFRGVPENVWNFHIGGYQVCEKWLKDRKGRTLTKDDIAHYHKIVISLTETIRLMAEIDQVIDTHGGWPGAFTSTHT